jgi:hypothetical protein
MFDAMEHQKIGEAKSDNVHKPVILKLEPANFKYNRADVLRQVLPPLPKSTHEDFLLTPFISVSQSYGIMFFMSKQGGSFNAALRTCYIGLIGLICSMGSV